MIKKLLCWLGIHSIFSKDSFALRAQFDERRPYEAVEYKCSWCGLSGKERVIE